jgi:hypothetical protein
VYQHYVPDFETLMGSARDCIESFQAKITDIAVETQGLAMVAPLKQEKRAQMKARFKYMTQIKKRTSIAWYRLTDLVRATIIYPDIASMYKGLESVIAWFGKDIRELNDRYVKPLAGGYRDLQMVVEHMGHMCELQLNTDDMIATKETCGHRTYDVRRELVQGVQQNDVPLLRDTLTWGETHLGGPEQLLGVLNDSSGSSGSTLLHEAARQGNDDMIRVVAKESRQQYPR